MLATTVLDTDRFGWTISTVVEQNDISANVHTLAGEFTIVDIMKTSLYHAATTLVHDEHFT